MSASELFKRSSFLALTLDCNERTNKRASSFRFIDVTLELTYASPFADFSSKISLLPPIDWKLILSLSIGRSLASSTSGLELL